MAAEVLVGVVLGFAVRCVFAGIQYAGELAGIQMGFSVASVIDPVTGNLDPRAVDEPTWGRLKAVMTTISAMNI